MLIHADCLEALRKLPDNSVDSVVTDPPYGLSFMGKKWDYDVPSVDIWQECLRVLKPGGHLLSFAGSRTYHRIACAIEDAGFEIRDQIMWVYGSGFPKSLDVGKAIDKVQGNERIEFDYVAPDGKKRWGGNTFSVGMPPDGRGLNKKSIGNSGWDGWGTALKPAHEPICVARKPVEGTVAANVLKWGTGAINIDGCRVETPDMEELEKARCNFEKNQTHKMTNTGQNFLMSKELKATHGVGRFPANIIHDGSDEVLECFPETKSAGNIKQSPITAGKSMFGIGENGTRNPKIENDIGGSASRFFYCAKASKAERGENNIHPTVKPIALMRYLVRLVTPPNGTVLDPFLGSGTTAIAAIQEGFDWIGIEREAEYCDIARARIAAAEPQQIEVAL